MAAAGLENVRIAAVNKMSWSATGTRPLAPKHRGLMLKLSAGFAEAQRVFGLLGYTSVA
jgi:hypothetical protein